MCVCVSFRSRGLVLFCPEKLRTMYYMFMSLISDGTSKDHIQKQGVVFILYMVGSHSIDYHASKLSKIKQLIQLRRSIPLKFAVIHSCGDYDPHLKFMFQLVRPLLSHRSFSRIQIHIGK